MVSFIVALSAGCGATVAGYATPAEQITVTRGVPGDLTSLLPAAAQFPPAYPAVVLSPEAAAQASGDLTGVARGASVQPVACAPPHRDFGPDATAIAVGTDNDTRATLTVELTRTTEPLGRLRAQLRGCGEMRVNRAGTVTTVRTELLDPTAVDADDTLALRRAVRPDVGGVGLTQNMRTLIAQIADVRITVTYMSFDGDEPDIEALDDLFVVAAREVREA
ncbi:hypothetical protein [Nocardia arizonensis]|uniref:hypothetical protein n=1 Tax=Nocardia arizonensis TaxID=1141647 RepID=UPI0006D02771|nr:hypothetical protein [Nocardia arizonensis]